MTRRIDRALSHNIYKTANRPITALVVTMIEGVRIKKLVRHGTDKGNFMELVRDDDGLLEQFGQVSISTTFPGIIKAFHWHEQQDDAWYVVKGNVQVVLHDLRKDSNTYKETHVLFAGELYEPQVIVIPKGIAHGYKVLGDGPVVMLYMTTKSYNAKDPDERRIPFDDPGIGFDWDRKYG